MNIKVLTKSDLNSSIQSQISKLFMQLSPKKKQVDLKDIMLPENPMILVYCEDRGKVLGMASLCHYKVVSGNKGWIEDVVVDNDQRGRGIGKQLIETLIEVGNKMHLSEILLFTEDHRVDAIRLYTKLGFKLKESRIYTLKS